MAQLSRDTLYQPISTVEEAVSPSTAIEDYTYNLVVVPRRFWYKHWCCCCGDCNRLGWDSFLLSCFCPCIAFGLNRKRAFAQSALLWGVLFFVLMSFSFNYCKTFNSGDDDQYSDTYSTECLGFLHIFFGFEVAAVGGFVSSIALIILGIMNRTSLRKKFALEGNVCTDCLLWTFCTSCALCQETRTLWYNCITDGVWRGMPQVHVPPGAQGAPTVLTLPNSGQEPEQVPGMTAGVSIPMAGSPAQQVLGGQASLANQEKALSEYPDVLSTA